MLLDIFKQLDIPKYHKSYAHLKGHGVNYENFLQVSINAISCPIAMTITIMIKKNSHLKDTFQILFKWGNHDFLYIEDYDQ